MATVSFLFLLFSAFSPPAHTAFHLIQRSMTWTAAQAACREDHTDLATVGSDEDNTELHNMINTAWDNMINTARDKRIIGVYWGWIGLHRGNFREKWSNGDLVTFRNVAGDCGASACCAAMSANGSWESLQCTETKPFMCYKQDDSSQTPDYHLILENKTWYEAQRYCRRNYTDLVSIRDEQQNEEVENAELNSATPFWIGLLRDDWQWRDGGNSAYRNWRTGQPRATPYDCVVLYQGFWYSEPCDHYYYDRHPFVPVCYSSNIHVSDEALSWEDALDYCRQDNRAGILNIDSDADQKEVESELRRRGVPPGSNIWVGLGPNRLSERKVSSRPLTCEDVARQTRPPPSDCPADTPPDYVLDSDRLRVVCKLK